MFKIAVQSPKYAAMVVLPRNVLLTKENALASGYVIAKDEADAAAIRAEAGELSGAGASYLDALLALPEAKERPLAAARIAAKHTPKTMSLAKAGLFLSGLPTERRRATMNARLSSTRQRPMRCSSARSNSISTLSKRARCVATAKQKQTYD